VSTLVFGGRLGGVIQRRQVLICCTAMFRTCCSLTTRRKLAFLIRCQSARMWMQAQAASSACQTQLAQTMHRQWALVVLTHTPMRQIRRTRLPVLHLRCGALCKDSWEHFPSTRAPGSISLQRVMVDTMAQYSTSELLWSTCRGYWEADFG